MARFKADHITFKPTRSRIRYSEVIRRLFEAAPSDELCILKCLNDHPDLVGEVFCWQTPEQIGPPVVKFVSLSSLSSLKTFRENCLDNFLNCSLFCQRKNLVVSFKLLIDFIGRNHCQAERESLFEHFKIWLCAKFQTPN